MWMAPRIGLKPLAMFCRRLGTSLSAGIDVRKTISNEVSSGANRVYRAQMEQVLRGVSAGDSLSDAFSATDQFFPSFFREMVDVGEKTGTLDRVLSMLADHYEQLLRLRSIFFVGITWSVIQLALAVVIIGILILVLGFVSDMTGETTDILGFGLVGVPGFIRYVVGLCFLAALGYGIYWAIVRSSLNSWLRSTAIRIPVIGPSLEVMALSRMAWSLGLAVEAGADAGKSLQLAIKSTSNPYYTKYFSRMSRELNSGLEIHEVLANTHAFPNEFVDAIEVGEQSGRLPEMMAKLAEGYQDRAKTAATTLTVVSTIAVWAAVAIVLILLILRIFSVYLGVLQDATQI